MKRDIGLQPERTSMAWLRTQLILFVIGILLFKIGRSSQASSPEAFSLESISLELCGLVFMLFAIFCTYYTSTRFSKMFNNAKAVTLIDLRIKIVTSVIVSLSAFIYALFLLTG